MTNYSNTYIQQIFVLLKPLVGEFMAKGIIKSQVQKLGKTEENITKLDIPSLAEDIRKGLVAFLGSDLAAKVGDKIKSF
ncbi:MAG: hypothetical protein AB7S48_17060 [Bacteroidales bacterium]